MSSHRCRCAFAVLITLIGSFCWLIGSPELRGGAIADTGDTGTASEQKAAGKENADQEALSKDVTQGALRIVQDDGQIVECPLRHTEVDADVSGFIARVKVTQTFHNPTDEKIEAVYVFPLPHEAAVDDMTMRIGDRKILGVIKKRADARIIYEQALAQGQTAALLEQERPNIFTQSVANIGPGEEVKIEISYVDVLRYDVGQYEFHFPMVVGPRYNPGAPIASPTPTPKELAGNVSPPQPDTTRVPDASRISPPVLKPGVRNGHDVMVRVQLDAGVPIQGLESTNHQTKIQRTGDRQATIELAAGDTIPNKDFVLRYDVVGSKPEMAVLAHTGAYSGDAKRLGDGYFMLMIQPKEDERLTASPPREIVFLVDVSGSMSGEPIAKASACMREMAKICRPEKDTLQVITFAGSTNKLFEKPMAATEANIMQAVQFAQAMKGGGGTEMLQGIKAAIDEPIDQERVRIVVMLTDGYIGNEAEIIEHVGRNCGDQVRFWTVGIGQAPNMFLVDGVARQGGGMGKKLGLRDDETTLAQEIMTRIQRAQLANVNIEWGPLEILETFPAKIPELWAGRPVILFGRYRNGGDATVKVSGNVEGAAVTWPLKVQLPMREPGHDVLAKVWARRKIEDLMQQSFYAGAPEVEEAVTALALDYKLMSQYTSFVAVDAEYATQREEPADPPRRMTVPVPLPEGTRWEGFFGPLGDAQQNDELALGIRVELEMKAARQTHFYAPAAGGVGGGYGGGLGGGLGGGGFGAADFREQRSRGTRGLSLDGADRYRRFALGSSLAPALQPAERPAGARQLGDFARTKYRGLATANLPYGNNRSGRDGLALPVSESLFTEIADKKSLEGKGKSDPDSVASALALTQQGLAGNAESLSKSAAQVLAAAKAAQEKGSLDAARELLTHAIFWDQAAANFGGNGGKVATEALTALNELQAQQVKQWSQELPGLDKRLDLVLRDQTVEQAIARVADAAGLSISIAPGSLDDAAALSGDKEMRISYLDLRRATVVQALDWLLQPAALSWWKAKDGIAVKSDRRREGRPAWVYDVSLIAMPDAEELQKLGDVQKSVAGAQRAAEGFRTIVRAEIGAKQNDAVAWFAPGLLLVIGTPGQHAKAEKLFADLSNDRAKLRGAVAALQRVTAPRYGERLRQAEQTAKAKALWEVARVHEQYGWQLLAGAAAGSLDLEALTELQIAWRRPETAELLKGAGRALVLRSWWIVSESSRALPAEKELTALVEAARQAGEPVAQAAAAMLADKPNDAEAFTAVLYSALALHDREFTAKALPLLTRSSSENDPLAAARTIAFALLSDGGEGDDSGLAKVLKTGVTGPDLTVLLALACRRTGGEAWNTYRGAAVELIGGQPLAGSIVVLLHRLSTAQFPMVAQR